MSGKKIIILFFIGLFVIAFIAVGIQTIADSSKEKKLEKYLAYDNSKESSNFSDIVIVISPVEQDKNIASKVKNAATLSGKTEQSIYGQIDNAIAKISAEMTKKGITVVDRQQTDKILEEMRWQLSDWASEENMATIGKALNANYILIVDPVFYDKGSFSYLNGTFLNVETMVKKIYSSYYYSDWDFSLLSSMTGIEGKWYYDGLMVSSVSYKSDTMKWVTPFSNGYKLAKADKKINEAYLINDLSYILIDSDNSEAYYANQLDSCSVSFSKIEADRTKVNGSYVSTLKAGTITIRNTRTGKQIVQGDVFVKDNILYVLAGFTKDNSGKAIFHMFSR